MENQHQWIIDKLPYAYPFLFVDEIISINDVSVKGTFTFAPDLPFYTGHFKNNPVTPGVILTECMAQIGLVCLGIFMLKDQLTNEMQIGMTSANSDFYIPVLPGEKVVVESEKIVFRFNKLKAKCKMFNQAGKLICKSEISGMFKL